MAKSKNERKSEALTRDRLEKRGYYADKAVTVSEQIPDNKSIKSLLNKASKSGSGAGYPEFIIEYEKDPEFLVVIECKASVAAHQSADLANPKDYAVDGAIHYAKALSAKHNVVAIGVSGQSNSELRVSVHVVRKNAADTPEVLRSTSGSVVGDILSIDDFFTLVNYNPQVQKQKEKDVLDYSKELHNLIRDHAHLSDNEKPLLVSGVLLALSDPEFFKSFETFSDKRLPRHIADTVKYVIDEQEIPNSKKLGLKQQYGFLQTHSKLIEKDESLGRTPLREVIEGLKEKVFPFISIYQDYDIVGRFYHEFLRYSGGDGKLGIVLTPKHITELFADLADLTLGDIVLDPCCGTGSFLITAMHRLCAQAVGDSDKIARVKEHCLIGVESQPKMFALAASNMILRGDGNCRLYEGSCFNESIQDSVVSSKVSRSFSADKSGRPNKGMINPPYSLKGEGLEELQFLLTLCDYLRPSGLAIAIVPIQSVIEKSDLKRQLMKSHTLRAVISMPDDLFGKAATVVSCIMIVEAHRPHKDDDKVWLRRFKDDGFVTLKHIGRVDHFNRWPLLRDNLLESYRKKEVTPGLSVEKTLKSDDEWCAEAYLETDYSRLLAADFEQSMRDYVEFLSPDEIPEEEVVETSKWADFTLTELFDLKRGTRVVNRDMNEGKTPLVRCSKENNAITSYVDIEPIFPGNVLSVNYNGSVGETFYQKDPFFATDDVIVFVPKESKFDRFDEAVGLFVATVLKLERFRYHYSRKWNLERMKTTTIKLPAVGKKVDVDAIDALLADFRFADQLGSP